MTEFPSNSRVSKETERKEPEKKLTRVVQGDVVRRKKPLSRRFKEMFFGGIDARGVWGYIAQDILIPATRDAISESFHEGFDRMWEGRGGEERYGRSRRRHRGGGPHPYHRYSSNSRDRDRDKDRDRDERDRPSMSQRGRQMHDFDEIILPSRVAAQEVISQMFDIVEAYDAISVWDLYILVGIEPEYVDKKYGWYDLRGVGATRVRGGGYLLDIEKPEPLD